MIFVDQPYDGWASYGRTEAWAAVIRRKGRITATEGIRDEWDRYEHLGEVPALVPRSDSAARGAVAGHARIADTTTARLPPAEAHRGSALPAMQDVQTG